MHNLGLASDLNPRAVSYDFRTCNGILPKIHFFFLRIEAVALKKKNTDQPFLGGAARPNNQRSGLLIGLGFEP